MAFEVCQLYHRLLQGFLLHHICWWPVRCPGQGLLRLVHRLDTFVSFLLTFFLSFLKVLLRPLHRLRRQVMEFHLRQNIERTMTLSADEVGKIDHIQAELIIEASKENE